MFFGEKIFTAGVPALCVCLAACVLVRGVLLLQQEKEKMQKCMFHLLSQQVHCPGTGGAAERGVAERGAAERGATERGATERGAAERGVVEQDALEQQADVLLEQLSWQDTFRLVYPLLALGTAFLVWGAAQLLCESMCFETIGVPLWSVGALAGAITAYLFAWLTTRKINILLRQSLSYTSPMM